MECVPVYSYTLKISVLLSSKLIVTDTAYINKAINLGSSLILKV